MHEAKRVGAKFEPVVFKSKILTAGCSLFAFVLKDRIFMQLAAHPRFSFKCAPDKINNNCITSTTASKIILL
jgi:hypothetical protein